ncbi:MAG: hypothetical protein ACRDRS_13650 [Pseudonocardiaceae bacterium]
MVATLQYQYPLVELGGDPLGHSQAEEAGTDNNQVVSRRVHEGSTYRLRHVPDAEGPVPEHSRELLVGDSALACEKALAALSSGAVRVTCGGRGSHFRRASLEHFPGRHLVVHDRRRWITEDDRLPHGCQGVALARAGLAVGQGQANPTLTADLHAMPGAGRRARPRHAAHRRRRQLHPHPGPVSHPGWATLHRRGQRFASPAG